MKVRNWNSVAVVCCYVFVWIALPSAVVCQDYIEKACPGVSDDSPPVEVTLSCPADEDLVVSLVEAVFGKNQYGECTFTAGDCKDKLDTAIFEKECAAKPKCTVKFNRPLFSPTCGFATFIIVSYNCLKPVATSPPVVTAPPTSPPSTASSTPRVIQTTTDLKHKTTTGGAKNTQEDNTGLIVGCVFAVIITVVLLIIAIFMVVRRLVCGGDLSDDEEKKSSCNILPCMGERAQDDFNTKSGRNQDANSSSSTEPGNNDKSDGAATATSMRKRKKRGRRADKNQNMSPRLAPVGQEDEDNKSVSQTGKNSSVATAVDYSGAAAVFPHGGGSSARSSAVVEPSASTMPPITSTQAVKRHSSGARVMCGVDTTSNQLATAGNEVGRGEVMRRAGSGRDGVSKAGAGGSAASSQFKVGRGMDRVSWPGKDGYYLCGVAKADVFTPGMKEDVTHASLPRTQLKTDDTMAASGATRVPQLSSVRSYKTASGNFGDKTVATVTASGAKKRPLYDAVAVPNTETFTSC